MDKNSFATKLQYLLKQSNTKNITLAKAVQYDLSYISKWLSGKMLPSEKNIHEVIDNIAFCLTEGDCSRLLQEYGCNKDSLSEQIKTDLLHAYQDCKPQKTKELFHATQPITEVVQLIDEKTWSSENIVSVIDILSLPHENRLILAGIKNGHFVEKQNNIEYSMIIDISSTDCVYDSIFLIHMITSMSDIGFHLYTNKVAAGKLICCLDDYSISAFVFPGNKDCIAVNEQSDEKKIKQSISTLIDQENLIFRESNISEMIHCRDYIQTLISTNIRWLLGHIMEFLLPQDVFEELLEETNRNIAAEYCKLYRLSQNVIKTGIGKVMIYESAIANLVVDGIVDYYNKPVKLKPTQIIKCLEYYEELVTCDSQIRLIDGCFSDDFRYITNPCMFLSDSLCYVRLENNRYKDNILVLNDRTVKDLFDNFFTVIWTDRADVVTDDKKQIKEKIEHYKESAKLLMNV